MYLRPAHIDGRCTNLWRTRLFSVCWLFLACQSPAVWAETQIPEGYEVIRLTDDEIADLRPSITNRGDAVWERRLVPSLPDQRIEIFAWMDGRVKQLTNGLAVEGEVSVFTQPGVNVHRSVVFEQRVLDGPQSNTIAFLAADGELVSVTNPGLHAGPEISADGSIAWISLTGGACTEVQLSLQRDGALTVFGGDRLSNQSPCMNDKGAMAWIAYENCPPDAGFWVSTVKLLASTGNVLDLSNDRFSQPQSCTINSLGQVAWSDSQRRLWIWTAGVAVQQPLSGFMRGISDSGAILYNRYSADLDQDAIWMSDESGSIQIAPFDDSHNGDRAVMNDYLEVLVEMSPRGGLLRDREMYIIRRKPAIGDCDGDADIDLVDLVAMQLCVKPDGEPLPPHCAAFDYNTDGQTNTSDAAVQLQALTGPGYFGDIDGDHDVDLRDFCLLQQCAGRLSPRNRPSFCRSADLNLSGIVDAVDGGVQFRMLRGPR